MAMEIACAMLKVSIESSMVIRIRVCRIDDVDWSARIAILTVMTMRIGVPGLAESTFMIMLDRRAQDWLFDDNGNAGTECQDWPR
jgi:hypothetical protein